MTLQSGRNYVPECFSGRDVEILYVCKCLLYFAIYLAAGKPRLADILKIYALTLPPVFVLIGSELVRQAGAEFLG